MNRLQRLSIALVMLVATALLAAGCARNKANPDDEAREAFDDVRAELVTVVEDPERQSQALALLDQLQAIHRESNENIDLHRVELRRINADYDATPEQLRAEFDRFNALVKQNNQQIWQVREQFAALLTAEEWDELEKRRTKALDATYRALKAI